MMQSFLVWPGWEIIFWGNTLGAYVHSLGIFLLLIFVFFVAQRGVIHRVRQFAERTETEIDNAALRVAESFRPPLYVFAALYCSLRILFLADVFRLVIDTILILLITYQTVAVLRVVLELSLERLVKRKSDGNSRAAAKLLGSLIMGVVWVLGALVALSNIGVNVTALLAGVGIGGIAIAFALQNILKDLFSSFSLYFEKPFTVGDFIVAGENSGTVKEIGFKTTRIRSVGGEEVIIPNSELTSQRVENYKKMERRHVFRRISVSYETSSEVLEKIPLWLEEIARDIDCITFDRANFRDFGENGLVFEYVYYVETGKYKTYMQARQSFNFAIKKKFEQENVSFAYPMIKVIRG